MMGDINVFHKTSGKNEAEFFIIVSHQTENISRKLAENDKPDTVACGYCGTYSEPLTPARVG